MKNKKKGKGVDIIIAVGGPKAGGKGGPKNATGPRAKAGTCPKLKKQETGSWNPQSSLLKKAHKP